MLWVQGAEGYPSVAPGRQQADASAMVACACCCEMVCWCWKQQAYRMDMILQQAWPYGVHVGRERVDDWTVRDYCYTTSAALQDSPCLASWICCGTWHLLLPRASERCRRMPRLEDGVQSLKKRLLATG